MSIRRWLFLVAALTAASQSCALPTFGSQTNISVGLPGTNGGAGQVSSQANVVYANHGTISEAHGAAALADGSLHAHAHTGQVDCTQWVFDCVGYLGHLVNAYVNVRLWDHAWITNTGLSTQLIPMDLHIDGQFSGIGAQGRYRYFWGLYDPRSDMSLHVPWHTLTSGDTVIDRDWPIPPGAQQQVWIYLELEVMAVMNGLDSSIADFGHTMRFDWTLPAGVSARSDSGVFLTAADDPPQDVDEPPVLALSGAALLALLAAQRRHRRSPAAPSTLNSRTL